jgi:hypothetical protein
MGVSAWLSGGAPWIKVGSPVLIKNRYEVKDVLGRGGMGVVYKAFDTLMRREVAVKTLRDVATSAFVDLFYRECSVLTAMVHPNIVEIFDMGEFEEDGVLKPYFVMPLLPGRTLYDLIYPSGNPLAAERCADIISQACRGLHAAHECGLLHRDIKPRNIFVMRDDAVKLIDFGVVRLLGSQTIGAPGTLGTLHYMAPEQISMKALTARSDIFSLATVCYEALTGVQPFQRDNEADTANAVTEHTPPLACALNPQVSRPLSKAVAQAMAKDPRNRFESAIAFADALQRGLRNERPGASVLTNPQNRLARAQRSFARGDYEFAREILDQLDADGLDEAEILQLRGQLDEAVHKRELEVHLTTARRYFDQEEYALALRRVAEVLAETPGNEDALSLKARIESKLNDLHVADSLARAGVHLDNGAFSDARTLLNESLRRQPDNPEVQRMLKDAEQRALDWPKQRQQQEELFQAAQTAYFEGRFDTSLRALEQLAQLTRDSKAAGSRIAEYKNFYARVRSDYDALQAMLADARKLLANDDFEGTRLLSDRLREQFPQDPDVLALGRDIAARRNDRELEYRRGIQQRVANESDLSARLHILNQAARSRPTDDYFSEERQKVQTQLQKVVEFEENARGYEAGGHFDYAVEEWLCIGDIYPGYPGLQEQLSRVKNLWKDVREKEKLELASQVKQALKQGDQADAAQLLRAAQAEFQGDGDYQELQTLVEATAQSQREVSSLLSKIQTAEAERRYEDIPMFSQAAVSLAPDVDPLRKRIFETLTSTGSRLTSRNWGVAAKLLDEAAKLGAVPAALHEAIRLEEREQEVNGALAAGRGPEADLEAYSARVAAVLAKYPDESRLEERLQFIDAALVDKRKENEKRNCAAELALLCQELGTAKDHTRFWDTYIQAKNLAAPFAGDPDVTKNLDAIGEQGSSFEEAAEALSRDRIEECVAICDTMLAKWPGHQLFQKVRGQADQRHRELGEEYFARVERWLASASDLYEREQIVLKAQAEYPFDGRYAQELQNLEREKSLAESLASKARDFEKRGQIPEALAQWRQLRNIHPSYPGLEEHVAQCESIIDRQQRKLRAQKLVVQGQMQFAEGHFAEGFSMVHDSWELSQEIPDLLRSVAPDLVAGAKSVLPNDSKLAEAMVNLAQTLDEGLRIPKEMRTRISEVRKAEDLTECLKSIQAHNDASDLKGALAVADAFLVKFPGVKQVESLRSRLALEVEQQRKQQSREQALDQFRDMESRAVTMSAPELLSLKTSVHAITSRNVGDEEVTQRASTLDSLFSALAEVRGHLQAGNLPLVEQSCARAFETFPGHPLFKSALAEAAKQKTATASTYIDEVMHRMAAENDFAKQSAIVREAVTRYPDDHTLQAELSAVEDKRKKFDAEVAHARDLEAKQSFGEAIKEWEAIRKAYPWYSPAVEAQLGEISISRRKDKQEALDRWFRQVETAIETGDYETASTMIRQAEQQQPPDRTLQALDRKLQDGLKRKQDSDALFAQGKQSLAGGALEEGGKALYRAFELQPKDKEKTDSIVLALLGQIRAHINDDFAACQMLLAHVNRIRPGQKLAPDLSEIIAKKQQAAGVKSGNTEKLQQQLANFERQAEAADSKKSLSAVNRKLQASELLNSNDVEVRRNAAELYRKINLRLSAFDQPDATTALVRTAAAPKERPAGKSFLSWGTAIAFAFFLAAFIGIVFFLSRPGGVPVQINVTPDHATVELNGETCVTPNCKFLLKPGAYIVKVKKKGFNPRIVSVAVKSGDYTPINLTAALQPVVDHFVFPEPVSTPKLPLDKTGLATIKIKGALPKTRVRLDGEDIGLVSEDGRFVVDVPPGPHTLDLSLNGFGNRIIKRELARGEILSLAQKDVLLEPRQPEVER